MEEFLVTAKKPGRIKRALWDAEIAVEDAVKKAVGKAKKIRKNIKDEDIYLKDGSFRSKKVVRKTNPRTGESDIVSIDDRPTGSAIKSVIGLKKGGKIPTWQHHVKSKYGK